MQRFEGLNRQMVEMLAPNPGRKPLVPELSPKAQVALMCRMLFEEGWNELNEDLGVEDPPAHLERPPAAER